MENINALLTKQLELNKELINKVNEIFIEKQKLSMEVKIKEMEISRLIKLVEIYQKKIENLQATLKDVKK